MPDETEQEAIRLTRAHDVGVGGEDLLDVIGVGEEDPPALLARDAGPETARATKFGVNTSP